MWARDGRNKSESPKSSALSPLPHHPEQDVRDCTDTKRARKRISRYRASVRVDLASSRTTSGRAHRTFKERVCRRLRDCGRCRAIGRRTSSTGGHGAQRLQRLVERRGSEVQKRDQRQDQLDRRQRESSVSRAQRYSARHLRETQAPRIVGSDVAGRTTRVLADRSSAMCRVPFECAGLTPIL